MRQVWIKMSYTAWGMAITSTTKPIPSLSGMFPLNRVISTPRGMPATRLMPMAISPMRMETGALSARISVMATLGR